MTVFINSREVWGTARPRNFHLRIAGKWVIRYSRCFHQSSAQVREVSQWAEMSICWFAVLTQDAESDWRLLRSLDDNSSSNIAPFSCGKSLVMTGGRSPQCPFICRNFSLPCNLLFLSRCPRHRDLRNIHRCILFMWLCLYYLAMRATRLQLPRLMQVVQ